MDNVMRIQVKYVKYSCETVGFSGLSGSGRLLVDCSDSSCPSLQRTANEPIGRAENVLDLIPVRPHTDTEAVKMV